MRCIAAVAIAALSTVSWAADKNAATAPKAPPKSASTTAATAKQNSAQIARGKYLVDSVAKCGDCHSPHNERGEQAEATRFHGSKLPFKPLIEMPWADEAPPLAGLPNLNEEQVTKVLTGEMAKDLPLRPPMPEYNMSKADAAAIAAYLKSLKGPQKTEAKR